MLALVGLHVAAALYHYAVRRDRVLQRMLPGM
jgi:cytochrome b561